MKAQFDLSTINKKELNKLPLYKGAPTYHLQTDPGNGCFLDPPGYPTYFTQSVYTQHGNVPGRGAQMVILGRVVESTKDHETGTDWAQTRDIGNERLRKLWMPLPLEHPRTKAWKIALYNHLRYCYFDADAPERDRTLIFPVPDYKLRKFHDDPRFSEEWSEKERAASEQANTEIIAHASRVATPDNHQAVRKIREYYPGYQPELHLMNAPPNSEGNWWERLAGRPTPETCPGQYGQKHNDRISVSSTRSQQHTEDDHGKV